MTISPLRARLLLAALLGVALLAADATVAASAAPVAPTAIPGRLEAHEDWVVQCHEDGNGYCSASTFMRGARTPDSWDARLRLLRPTPGARVQLLISALFVPIDVTRDVSFLVDDAVALALDGGHGLVPASTSGDWLLEDTQAAAGLLAKLRAGRQLDVRYHDAAGVAQELRFSLEGMSAALDAIAARDALLPQWTAQQLRAPGRAGSWSQHLIDLLPALEACADETPARPVVVVDAWRGEDRIEAVTRGSDGRRWRCRTTANGRALLGFDAVDAAWSRPPTSPAWRPASATMPPRECFETAPVVDAEGQRHGWLSVRLCARDQMQPTSICPAQEGPEHAIERLLCADADFAWLARRLAALEASLDPDAREPETPRRLDSPLDRRREARAKDTARAAFDTTRERWREGLAACLAPDARQPSLVCLADAYRARLARLETGARLEKLAAEEDSALAECLAEAGRGGALGPCLEHALEQAIDELGRALALAEESSRQRDGAVPGRLEAEAALARSQEAFRQWRRSTCQWKAVMASGGTSAQFRRKACAVDLTRRRTAELLATLDEAAR